MRLDSETKEPSREGQKQTNPLASPDSPAYGRYVVKLSAVALIVAICLPFLQQTPWSIHAPAPSVGVTGRAVPIERTVVLETEAASLLRRDDSPTDVCTRWSHQSAVVNGTLYVYGGQATTEPSQTENKWNNYFLSMDLTNGWQISTPSMTGLSQPSGPPNVSNGYLWNSHESLFLYGGEFSDSPAVAPSAFSLWEYNIASSQWTEHSNPTTSTGTNSDSSSQSVQRAAEGAGASVAALGRGWYFGGHEDAFTTEGWSQSVARIYVKSLIEFTFPGYENNQVDALSDSKTAGSDGAWRNVTEGGSQESAGFPERADGLLLYIPGFGAEGILLGLAGGTNDTFTQMNVIDVYDIATSTWYKQATSGSTPKIRVNPCAVVAAAADGSSYQVYMYGGQNLQPAGEQIQYDDTWILTIPSFTWIQVDQSNQSVPPGRAGHTCHIWDSQMVVVGGYVGTELSCDNPGVYVFNASSLQWQNQFTALSGSSDSGSSGSSGSSASGSSTSGGSGSDGSASTATASGSAASATGSGSNSNSNSGSNSGSAASATGSGSGASSTFVSNQETNPFNQQVGQIANSSSPGGLEGSYGYLVPDVVISVIGGNSLGGATVTAPAQTATDGPLKTGSAIIYSTPTTGATTTATSTSGSDSGSGSNDSSDGPNIAAIVAGVIAGILFVIVCYLAFCAWLYRKRLELYKRHVEMAQRQALNEKVAPAIPGLLPTGNFSSSEGSSSRKHVTYAEDNSGRGSSRRNDWGWTGDGRNGSIGAMQGSLLGRRSSDDSGAPEDLLADNEPSFWGTVLAPRRSLRVVNKD